MHSLKTEELETPRVWPSKAFILKIPTIQKELVVKDLVSSESKSQLEQQSISQNTYRVKMISIKLIWNPEWIRLELVRRIQSQIRLVQLPLGLDRATKFANGKE